jgi:hypothetical protein
MIAVCVDELRPVASDFEFRTRHLLCRSVQGNLKTGDIGVEESVKIPW